MSSIFASRHLVQSIARFLALPVMLMALAACGGGGGGSSEAPAAAPTSPPAGSQPQTDPPSTSSSFKVGGGVKGLAGRGLVLQLNGMGSINVNAEGVFQFSDLVESGSQYSVSVKTQPTQPSQTCTVNDGVGIMGQQDVSDVAVVCSTNAFKIGGTVSGLQGNGLVLVVNGDELPISADGKFTFKEPIASGADYMVTVKSTPTGPNQFCGVASASGVVGLADIESILVTCSARTYQVFVTVQGLAGDLRVQLGAQYVHFYGSASPTPFAIGQVADGAPYAVTISQQPSNQTCSVVGATGVIAGADVTSVSVLCSDASHRLGAQVLGYDGVGLVLQNNGGDDLTVDADGLVWFPTRVVSGGQFNITIKDAPKTPDQVCLVANGSGVINQDVSITRIECSTPASRLAFYGDGEATSSMRPPGVEVRGFSAPGMLGGFAGTFRSTESTVLGVVIDPSGENLYAVTDSQLHHFPILGASGLDASPGTSTFAGSGSTSISMDPLGRFVIVLNRLTRSFITFPLDPITKSLGAGVHTSLGVVNPVSATIDPSGRYFVVKPSTGNEVEAFALLSDGSAAETGQSRTDHAPAEVVFHPSSNRLWISYRDHNSISNGYILTESNPGGAGEAARIVTTMPSVTNEPAYRMAISPSGKYIASIEGTMGSSGFSKLVTYSIAANGRLTRVDEKTLPANGEVGAIAFEPSGQYVHVVQPLYTTIYKVNRSGMLTQSQWNYKSPLAHMTSVAILE